jgi:hypothetical protein
MMGEPMDGIDAGTPVLLDPPEMSSLALQSFCNDVARQIHTPEEIAERYGFSSARAALQWVSDRPAVRRAIKELRAIWESEDNLQMRIQAYYGHALLEAAPDNAKIMLDPTIHPSVRIDAMKEAAKLAGVVGGPSAARNKDGSVISDGVIKPFAVNIIFNNAGLRENIETIVEPKPSVTIEGEPSP